MHICIVDPRTNGHSPTYLRMLADAFRARDWQVSAIVTDPAKIVDQARYSSIETLPASVSVTRGTRYWRERQRLRDWQSITHAANRLARGPTPPPDLFLLAWLDGLVLEFSNELRRFSVGKRLSRFIPNLIDRAFPHPWAGLYFLPHPQAAGDLHLCLNARHCRGVFVLNELVIPYLAKKVKSPISFLPDATDATYLPGEEAAILQRFGLIPKSQLRSAGKTVVACIGSIEKRKGVLTLLDLAQVMDPTAFHFLLAGELNDRSFSPYEVSRIKTVAQSVEAITCIFQRIPEESEFNALVNYADILYLAYQDFPGSSNLLTKAAHFKKQVLATRNSPIGDRVERFALGSTVDPHSLSGQCDAIRKLAAAPVTGAFEQYAKEFSIENFNAALCGSIDTWLKRQG